MTTIYYIDNITSARREIHYILKLEMYMVTDIILYWEQVSGDNNIILVL